MADQPDTVRCTPGTMSLKLRLEETGVWRWSLSWALADQLPTEAPGLATGTFWSDDDRAGLDYAFQRVLSSVMGSAGSGCT